MKWIRALLVAALLSLPAQGGEVMMMGYGAAGDTCTYATVPTVTVGAIAGSVTALSGQPTLPTGTVDGDLLILVFETDVGEVPTVNGGLWTEAPSSPQEVGSAGSGTRLTAFYKIADADSNPSTNDPGDHIIGEMLRIPNAEYCHTNIFVANNGNTQTPATTSISISGATTSKAHALVLAITSGGADGTSTADVEYETAGAGKWANSDLASVTELADNRRMQGNGGEIGIAYGEKVAAGAYGATTVSANISPAGSSTERASITLAIAGS